MSRWGVLAYAAIVVIALCLRLPQLSVRPLHNDEGVNAVKVSELWQKGEYAYDPDEYHGPTLHYFSLPFLKLGSASSPKELGDGSLRVSTVAFGLAVVMIPLIFRQALGTIPMLWAALLSAVSPAMVFYSRYFIHEMLLIFFTAAALGCFWRYSLSHRPAWAVATGGCIGLMFATKETFVLTLAAWGLAWAFALATANPSGERLKVICQNLEPRPLVAGLIGFTAIWLLFFSSFFHHMSGLLDSIKTYLPWLKRAGGHSPHIHPWHFYLDRLAWFHPTRGPIFSEAFILALAAVGTVKCLRVQSVPHRFLAIYSLILCGIYSIISYKTPWCLLNFHHGFILLAGIGAGSLTQSARDVRLKSVVCCMLAGFSIQLAVQARRASGPFAADRRNPYVYAQTSNDILNLIQKVETVAQSSSRGFKNEIKVVAPEGDYWPLPWYLRKFEKIGWHEVLPKDPPTPFMIVSTKFNAMLDEKTEKKWIMAGIFELRPKVHLELYVETELWKNYVNSRPRKASDGE